MVISEENKPLTGVVVQLNAISVSDTTDNSGRFTFENVPQGSYMLSAYKPGSSFIVGTKKIIVHGDAPLSTTLTLRQRTYTVDEVVVVDSSSSQEKRMEDEPSQIDVVTRAEFEHNAVTVEEVIASTPSASISSYGGLGSFSEVSLRGSYSNQVQIYIDGMLLNESVGGSVNLGLIPLNNVDRVEIWRSGAPASFGGDVVGGAINIVTRDYQENKGSVSLGYGSFGTVKGNGVFGFGSSDSRLLVTLDAATSRNDYDYKSDNGTPQNPDDDYTTYRRNNDFHTYNGLIKYRRILGTGFSVELSEHLLKSRKNLPSTQHILYSDTSLRTTKNLFQTRFTWVPEANPCFEISPTFHSIVSREHYEDKGGHVGWGEQDNIYETVTYKGMAPLSLRYGKYGELSVTPVAAHESFSPTHRLDRTIPLSCDREHLGIVGDIVLYTPGRCIVSSTNIRRDRYFSDYEGQTNSFTPYPPEPQFHHFSNFQTGIKVEPHSLMSFRWNYGDNWRVPSFYELFGDRGGVVSASGLQPEHVYRWDIGARLRIPGWSEKVNGQVDFVHFDNSYHNLIQWYTNNYGFIEPANVAGSYVRGKELIWDMQFFDSLSLRGSWTFQDSKVTKASKIYHQGKLLPNRPDQYGTSTLEYLYRRVTASWIIDYKDKYFLDRSNQPHKFYPGRTLHDVCFTFGFCENKLEWRLMVENITDRKTFDIQGMPKPGRSFSVDVRYSL